MFKWFKKKAVKPVPNPSSIAPLYIASTNQIQGTIDAVNELSPKIDDLQNRLDNLPPIPDMSAYAKKNEANTFTQKQTFNRGMYVNNQKIEGLAAPVGNGDATHKLYVDTADNAKLREAKTYTDSKTQEAKTYTDTQIAAIPRPDLTNIPKLNAVNQFTTLNTFEAIFSKSILMDADYEPDDNSKVATKGYVDSKSSGYYEPLFSGLRGGVEVSCKDLDISGGNILYAFSYDLPIGAEHTGKEIQVSFYVNYQGTRYSCPVLTGYVNRDGNMPLKWNIVGYSGDFTVALMKVRFEDMFYRVSVRTNRFKDVIQN